jgi:deoxyinosine 3'endonuclease (endonuclease V)
MKMTLCEMAAKQERLRERLIESDDVDWAVDTSLVNFVAGVDVSFFSDGRDGGLAALVIVRLDDKEVVYEDYEAVQAFDIPYVSGFLGFREVELYAALIDRIPHDAPFFPQAVLVDGYGSLHPRRFGSACHLGVVCGLPTIGVAKKLMAVDGIDADRVMARFVAAREPITDGYGECRGVAMCGGGSKVPIYVSAGHRVALDTAVDLVARCFVHRIPEPVRQADLRSRARISSFDLSRDARFF